MPPLRSTGKAGHYQFMTGGADFDMFDENDQTVRCSVSFQALKSIDRKTMPDEIGMLQAFSRHRKRIEEIAIRRYDRGQFGKDGKTIEINKWDV
jgi:hypothetical protein